MNHRLRTARPVAKLRQGRNDWYQIKNEDKLGRFAEIYVYDEIGYWGVTANDFVTELSSVDVEQIDLHLNSPGGEVFDGIAIMEALRRHPANITTYVDSLAASIASVIAMAGNEIIMAKNATMMIHDGSGLCVGNASDMQDMADLLDKTSDNIASVYADRAGGTAEAWRAAMRAETWYTAEEAVAAGLADRVGPGSGKQDETPENKWDLSIFNYSGRAAAPNPVIQEVVSVFDAADFRRVLKEAMQ